MTASTQPLEPIHSTHAHTLCWKSVIAGVFISFMSYMILTALGAGVVGIAAQSAIENERNGNLLATGAGLWLGLSAIVSLFLGSYFTVRISKSYTNKVGAAHGLVVASIFFIVLMVQASSGIGALSRGLGSMIAGVSRGTAELSSSPIVQDTINSALGTANLKSEPKAVAEGLATRLMSGNTDSAKSYLAFQTGLTGSELDARVATLKSDFDRALKNAGETAAAVVANTGWSLFVTFLVGLLAALIGGRVGAHANLDRPLVVEGNGISFRPIMANERGGALPYLVGWLLGVPATILFLIFLLRAIF